MPCTAQSASETEKMLKSQATSAASALLNLPPRRRLMSQGASASIQAETSRATAKSREAERPTDVEKSHWRFCWKSAAKKGSEAVPAAGPMMLKGALKRSLALLMRV